jgi:hypothetical protein
MSHITTGDDRADQAILDCDIPDAALERAGGVEQKMAGTTLPNALLCIPFVAQEDGRVLSQSVNS